MKEKLVEIRKFFLRPDERSKPERETYALDEINKNFLAKDQEILGQPRINHTAWGLSISINLTKKGGIMNGIRKKRSTTTK